MNVKVGTITSWPALTPASFRARWIAEVPFTIEIAFFAPLYSAIYFSNLSTYDPSLETQQESMHSLRYFFSFPIKDGSERGITLDIISISFIDLAQISGLHPIIDVY